MRGRFTYLLGQSGPGRGPGQGSPTRVHVTRSEWTRTRGTRTRVSRGPGQGSPMRVHVVCQTEGSGPRKSPNLSLSVIGLRGYSIQPSLSLQSNANVCYAKIWLHFTKSVFMFSDEIK